VIAGGPKVLIIDDDDMVRRSIVRALRRKYHVSDVRDAESALALLASGVRFDAILSDLHLDGGISGRELIVHLKAGYPDQAERLVIVSGDSRDSVDDDFLDAIAWRFLEKPATLAEIDAMLADLVLTTARAA
jgi:CheY-like chemotaxis protein